MRQNLLIQVYFEHFHQRSIVNYALFWDAHRRPNPTPSPRHVLLLRGHFLANPCQPWSPLLIAFALAHLRMFFTLRRAGHRSIWDIDVIVLEWQLNAGQRLLNSPLWLENCTRPKYDDFMGKKAWIIKFLTDSKFLSVTAVTRDQRPRPTSWAVSSLSRFKYEWAIGMFCSFA